MSNNQLELLYEYNLQNRERFNEDLLNKKDESIIKEILNVILVCQRERFFTVKVKAHRVVDDPIEVHRILYENEQRLIDNKKKKKDNMYKYIHLRDSDVNLLIITYFVSIGGEDNTFDVIIAVPRMVNKYYFRLMGNLYTPMYQIVEGSTYNNSKTKSKKQSITLKVVFGPLKLYRNFIKLKDTNKDQIETLIYVSRAFNKSVNAIKFILAKFGLVGTLEFLGLKTIYITDKDPMIDGSYTFNKNNIYVTVPKIVFDGDAVTQSFVATLIKAINKDTKYVDIYHHNYWLSSLGQDFGSFNVDKGYSICESFEGLYDIATRDSIALPIEHKDNVYKIFRWMIREFSNLKVKDNLDLSTKKVRYAEYIASIYAMKLAKGIHRISDLGNRATILDMRKALETDPMYLIYSITKSTLVNYRNVVNDLDAYVPLKVTFKGISGIGENKKATISPANRRIYTEYVGRLGLDESSPSDPGLTGMLCPYVQLIGNRFSDKEEPLTWEQDYSQVVNDYKRLVGAKEVISFKKEITGDYDKEQEEIIDDSINTFKELIKPIYFVTKTSEIIQPFTFE